MQRHHALLTTLMLFAMVAGLPVSGRAIPATGLLPVASHLPTQLTINLRGDDSIRAGYTIGLFDTTGMTASVDDPDYQIQALQSDRVLIFQQAGSPAVSQFSITVGPDTHLGIFLLRGASLKDFSLGANPYAPVFSTQGAPGSHLLTQQNGLKPNQAQFAFQTYKAGGFPGGMMLAGPNLASADRPGLVIEVTGQTMSGFLQDDQNGQEAPDPVVPEPATLALFGLGLGLAGALKRRR